MGLRVYSFFFSFVIVDSGWLGRVLGVGLVFLGIFNFRYIDSKLGGCA